MSIDERAIKAAANIIKADFEADFSCMQTARDAIEAYEQAKDIGDKGFKESRPSADGLDRLKKLAENDEGAWVDFHGDLWDLIAFYEAAKPTEQEKSIFVGLDDHDDSWNGYERRKKKKPVPLTANINEEE